jgi:hypothetical protein
MITTRFRHDRHAEMRHCFVAANVAAAMPDAAIPLPDPLALDLDRQLRVRRVPAHPIA